MSNLPENYRFCPICHEQVQSEDYFFHYITEHPAQMALNALLVPNAEDIQTYFENIYNTAVDYMLDHDMLDYQSLSELCDEIGYHKVGISNILAVVNEKNKTELVPDTVCSICLEDLNIKDLVYELKKCKHIYCAECLQKWLAENKTCPICKSDIS